MTLLFQHAPVTIPYGTLVSNLAACFLIGVIAGLVEDVPLLSTQMRLFLATGVCGGFSTFSSLTYELMQMARASQYVIASFYIATTFLGAVAAFLLGIGTVKAFARLLT
jgi:CrcB protein